MTDPVPLFRRVIVTKRQVHELEPDTAGVPLAEKYPGAKLPAFLKDARTYQTLDGPVCAAPDRE